MQNIYKRTRYLDVEDGLFIVKTFISNWIYSNNYSNFNK